MKRYLTSKFFRFYTSTMIKTFCDLCQEEIKQDPEGFVLQIVNKSPMFDMKKVEQAGYVEERKIGCRSCKNKLIKLLEKL